MDPCCQRAYYDFPFMGCHSEVVIWLQCLSHQPHDPALAPSVDPSISLIPPVNASSSYYDGMNRLVRCIWWVTDIPSLEFSTDLVYIHMDLNTRVISSKPF